jgi:outer membrane protein assembly factor BamA
MGMGMKYYWLAAIMLCCSVLSFAQSLPSDTSQASPRVITYDKGYTTPFVIGEIYIEGNKRTKPYIIERELPFKRNDSIYLPQLVEGFEILRQQLINTALFVDVVISLKAFRGYYVDILIQVKERLYVFPIPYVKPVDRNLTEWARQGYSIDRLNYGFKFTYNNFTGRNDKLRIWLITGYTQKIEFQYNQPYADKSLKHGYNVGFSYSFNKEINYTTAENQQKFVDTLSSGIRQWYGFVGYTYRPGLRSFHSVRLSLTRQLVDSQVLSLNPKYFNSQQNAVVYPELSYTFNYYHVDYIPFPLTGWLGEFSFLKRGIHPDMNMFQLSGKLNKNWQLGKKNYFSWQGFGILRVPFDQPFINQRLFGYSDFYLRGLEKYVIDGVAGFLTRQTLRHEVTRFNIPTYIKSKSHDHIPFRIYARIFGDLGYSYIKTNYANSLNNRMLYTGGLGVDVVTFYDFILRFDYSFNQLGQNGLFLHVKGDF